MIAHPRITLAVVAVLSAAGIVGCRRGGGPGPDTPTEYTTPEGVKFSVKFPGKPVWGDIPYISPAAQGFIWEGGEGTHPHEVWVWTIPPDERELKLDSELASDYGTKAGGSNGVQYGPNADGIWIGGWHSQPFNESRGIRKGIGAAKVMIVGNRAYAVRVRGDNIGFDDPEFKTFFESFRPAELADRPPPAKPPEDDLRPLARIAKFPWYHGVQVAYGSVAISPNRGAAFRGRFEPGRLGNNTPAIGHITRYHYPSFRTEGEYEVSPSLPADLAADDAGKRLYAVLIGMSDDEPNTTDSRIAAFDIPEAPAAGKPILAPRGEIKFPGRVVRLLLAPGGKSLYALHQHVNKAELIRLDTDKLSIDARWTFGAMPPPSALPPGVQSEMCLTPDGKTLFASTGQIHEFDTAAWQLRRTFASRREISPLTIACDGEGGVYEFGTDSLIRTDVSAPGIPPFRKIELSLWNGAREGASLIPSPDGARLYVNMRNHTVFSLDFRELGKHGRVVVVAPADARKMVGGLGLMGVTDVFQFEKSDDPAVSIAPGGVIGPDGKCLLLPSGQVYWLAGAGPLPEVDPSAKLGRKP